jgi:hypothetical protein
LSLVVQVSVNNSIQLSSMLRFGIPLLVSDMSLLQLSMLNCTIWQLFSCQMHCIGWWWWSSQSRGECKCWNLLTTVPFQPNGGRTICPFITSLSTKQPAYGITIQVNFSDAAKIGWVSLICLRSFASDPWWVDAHLVEAVIGILSVVTINQRSCS